MPRDTLPKTVGGGSPPRGHPPERPPAPTSAPLTDATRSSSLKSPPSSAGGASGGGAPWDGPKDRSVLRLESKMGLRTEVGLGQTASWSSALGALRAFVVLGQLYKRLMSTKYKTGGGHNKDTLHTNAAERTFAKGQEM